jgi:hypothetical protein
MTGDSALEPAGFAERLGWPLPGVRTGQVISISPSDASWANWRGGRSLSHPRRLAAIPIS